MGLFDGLEEDFTEVEEISSGIPAGTYEAMVSAIETEEKDSGLYLVFSYTLTEEGPYKGRTHKEFKRTIVGRAQNDDDRKALGYIKARLHSLGITPEQMNTIDIDDIVGTEVALVLVNQRNNPEYRNVSRITVLNASTADTPTLPDRETTKAARGKKADPSEDPFA